MSREDAWISVVITNYNKEGAVSKAYDSAITQLEDHDEIIVIDDCSDTAKDLEALFELQKIADSRLSIVRNTFNQGASAAKNLGVLQAKNDIIVLLDADDVLPYEAIKNIRTVFESHDADIVFGDYLHTKVNGETEVVSCQDLAINGMLNLPELAKRWKILGTSPFKKSTCFNSYRFDPCYNRTDDVDFYRKLFQSGKRAYYTENIIYNWIQNEGGNNHKIPTLDIFLSHARSFDFFYQHLSFKDFLIFLAKFQIRLVLVSLRKIQFL